MTLSNALLVAAVILFILAALAAGGVIAGIGATWIAYTGLACFAAAHLPLP